MFVFVNVDNPAVFWQQPTEENSQTVPSQCCSSLYVSLFLLKSVIYEHGIDDLKTNVDPKIHVNTK